MMTIEVYPDWWKSLFDDVYLLTDARSVCDSDLTRREVEIFVELIPIEPEHAILDLCGGHGRHSMELYERGFKNCTVLDYSSHLINHGRACAADRNCRIEFIRADARETGLISDNFEHVLITGNSLGYLSEPEADCEILEEARRILRPGGWILIDETDGSVIKSKFNPNAWHEIGGDIIVCRQREMSDNGVKTREVVISREQGIVRDRTYSIRMYEPEDLTALVERAGFAQISLKTDFSLYEKKGDYGFMNHRMIVTAQKPA
jgi:D-alanine-D-alanine ligase